MATTPEATTRAVTLGPASAVAEGTARGFDPHDDGQDSIFAVRVGGILTVWRNACPHQGAAMALRKDVYLNAEATRIVCHAHGAQFLPESGLCVQGPCLGRRLRAVVCEVDARGELRVRLENP
jgi:nitrite reductase/ring-hydroxylating ferredoxin subunit